MHPRLLCFGHVRFSDAERRLLYVEGGNFEKRSPGDPRDPLLGSFVPYHEEIRLPSPYYRVDAYRRVRLDHDKIERDATVEQYESEHGKYLTYVQGEYRKMDAELSPLYERLSILREGSQKQRLRNLADTYQRERQQWYDDTVSESNAIEASFRSGVPAPSVLSSVWNVRPADRARFASMRYRYQSAHAHLPQMTERLKNEIKNLEAQFATETQGLIVNALVQWQKFEGLKDQVDAGVRPEELRAVGMQAVAAIDYAGSHLYANHSHANVMPWDEAAIIQEAQRQLATQGISLTAEEVADCVHPLTPDPKGIEALLRMKTELLGDMTERLPESDLNIRQALVLAQRRERRYLVMERAGADPARISDLDVWESEETAKLLELRQDLTDIAWAGGAPPEELHRLAQHELHFLQSFAPENVQGIIRMQDLDHRDPEHPGIIQQQRLAMILPLQEKNNALGDDLSTLDLAQARQALADIRAEGFFIHKYLNELPSDAGERMQKLVLMQQHALVRVLRLEFENAGRDPTRMVGVVALAKGELDKMAKSPLNAEFVAENTNYLLSAVRGLRVLVNETIVAARQTNRQANADPAMKKTEEAVKAIMAERRALSLLGIDADRIKELDENMDLIQTARDAESRLLPDSHADTSVGGAHFTRALDLIDTQERMMRDAGQLGPDQQRSLERRRAEALGLLSRTVDWAVPGLSVLSPLTEVKRIKGMVDAEWDRRGGPAMTDPKRLDELTRYKNKIAGLEQAAQQKEVEREAARRRAPLESARSLLENIDYEVRAFFDNRNARGLTIVGASEFERKLVEKMEQMHELKQQYDRDRYTALDDDFATWETDSFKTRTRLEQCLLQMLLKNADPRSIDRAAHIFITRYQQLRADTAALLADPDVTGLSGITSEQLGQELLGGNDPAHPAEGSLLKRAIDANIQDDVLRELQTIAQVLGTDS